MVDANVYFGIDPLKAQKLWDPTGGMLAERTIDTAVFRTGSGGARVSKALDGVRQYQLNYGALGRKNFEYLNAIHQGAYGPGPFVLVDPGRRNLLTANQSAGGSQSFDTRQFTVAGTGGTIASAVASGISFPRMLTWSFATSTPGTSTLTLDKPSAAWPGIPVISRPHTFWCWAFGATGAVSIQLQVQWYGLAGNALSASTSTLTATTVGSWVKYALRNITPPAGGSWAVCSVVASSATIAAGESVSFSQFMFQEGITEDSDWQLGTGIHPVISLSLPEKYGFAEPGMLVSPTLTLQEVR